jgi:hypothetical protein
MIRDGVRQGANVVFAVGQVVAVPLLQLGGRGDIGAVSDRYPTYVVPAGYAFSIWGLIFALSLAYAVYQALPAQRSRPLLRRVGWLTAATFLGATLWQMAFPAGLFWPSVALIFAMLGSLAVVVARTVEHLGGLSRADLWLVRVTFSIYLGWITVASVANVAQTLSAGGWTAQDPGAAGWGVAMLLAAGVIGAAVAAATVANLPYALTVIWALVAVVVGQRTGDTPVGTSATQAAAAVAAALVGAAVLLAWRRTATPQA